MSSQQELLRPASTPSVSLNDLLAKRNVEVIAVPADTSTEHLGQVSGITVNSREVTTGDVFVAVAGLKAHGAAFGQQAIDVGAAAILTDRAGVEVLRTSGVIAHDGSCVVPVVVGPSGDRLRHEMARWATLIYGDASARLELSGITGTNGKTTTAFFLDAIHRAAQRKTALLGTVEMRLGTVSVPSTRTTVEAPVLQGFFARCVEDNIDHVTMEVSSHALSLDRVTGAHFGVVGFTNLQHDHLDFHHTMEEYFEAKASLFTPVYARKGVVVADDKWSRMLVNIASIDVVSVVTDLCDSPDFEPDWRTARVRLADSGLGLDFDLVHRDGRVVRSHSPLLGAVNVSNAALATLMALESGLSEDDIFQGLTELAVVPGRMEVVSAQNEPLVIVDYAHTAEALDFALMSLRETHHKDGTGRLIVVFGAAGERDATKRPFMGAVAMKSADVVIVTDDDPYSEDPSAIRDEVVAGILSSGEYAALSESERGQNVLNIAPREDAIAHAIALAGASDTVLLAGRGHETIQDLDGVQHELDDRSFARARLADRE